jgi:valyl-tRNA synthetase
LNKTLETLEDHFSKFRISDALMLVYTMIRDDFSGWYLEAVKPAYQKPIDKKTFDATIKFFDQVVRILYPFMPFISEEVYQLLEERKDSDSIVVAEMPKPGGINEESLDLFDEAKEVITAVRNIRQSKNVPNKDLLDLQIVSDEKSYPKGYLAIINKLANISSNEFVAEASNGSVNFIVKTTEYGVPMGGLIDVTAEKKRLEEELKYQEGFLNSVMRKLENERFVNGAPEAVVNKERQKQADAEVKIKTIKEQLSKLG